MKSKNKMGVAVGRDVPWRHRESGNEKYKRYRAQGRHCGVAERTNGVDGDEKTKQGKGEGGAE